MKVGIVYQNNTAEADISKKTAEGIFHAVKNLGFQPHLIIFGEHFVQEAQHTDVIFIAMHGKYGEDGYIQTVLNAIQKPYTHSGVNASQIGMNKMITNLYAQSCDIPVLVNQAITKQNLLEDKYQITHKSVIKPVNGGSSVATFILEEGGRLTPRQKEEILHYTDGNLFMIEDFFKGTEVCVGILNNKVIGTCSISPQEEFYSYNAKYLSNQTTYHMPANITPSLAQKLQSDAINLHHAVGAHNISRVDFICNKNTYRLLEINTNPGMTATSLMPKICSQCNITYQDIIQTLLQTAKYEKI